MQMRALGRSGLSIAPLVLGGNVFGWTVDEATTFRLLDAFVDAGFNMLDTADSYPHWAPGCSGGESEAMIGKWLHQSGKRGKVLIATKCGKWERNPGLSPAAIRRAVDEALLRFRTDVIDLLQAHQFDRTVPQVDTLGAFADVIKAGKVRTIGASNFTATQMEAALATSRKNRLPRYESLQPQYNLVERGGYEWHLAPLAERNGLGVIPYYGLASGFLTGKYRTRKDLEGSARGSTAGKYLNGKGRRVLKALDDVAGRYAASPAQVALAWLMARPGVTAPITSATRVAQLTELMAAARLELSDDDVAVLDAASK